MNDNQIQLVQQSWQLVKPVASQAGVSFYLKLFATAPEIRHLFKENIEEQSHKLMTMLGYVVANLKNPALMQDIIKLGKRHNAYGAQPAHYDAVGQCLIATLEEGLGEQWSEELQEAWIAAFAVVKNSMIEAQANSLATEVI